MRNQETLQLAIQNISNIPTLPTVIEKITRLLQNPQTSAEEVGRAITTDQSIASKVLKLVNSAFYGFPGKISTITHAIVILGFSTVKNIVLTASIFDFFQKRGQLHPDFDMEQFWQHSLACGAASQAIAKYIGYEQKEECFIGGLVHDIGKVALCQYLPEDFELVVKEVKKKGILFYDAEREQLGTTHEEIGAVLTERWNLPKNLQDVVRYHHHPSLSQTHRTMTGIVQIADVFIRALDFGYGGDDKIPLIDQASWKKLGFSSLALGPLLQDIDEEVEKASTMMQAM